MSNDERREIINAARSYEKIVAERRAMYVRSVSLHRDGRKEESHAARQEYFASKDRARAAEKLLTRRLFDTGQDFVRVDGVIYMAYDTANLLRVCIEDVSDLAEVSIP